MSLVHIALINEALAFLVAAHDKLPFLSSINLINFEARESIWIFLLRQQRLVFLVAQELSGGTFLSAEATLKKLANAIVDSHEVHKVVAGLLPNDARETCAGWHTGPQLIDDGALQLVRR